MRYRIGTQPDPAGLPLDQGMFALTAVLSLVIGAGFVLAGLRSRHYWMSLWGAGLVLCSTAYLLYLVLVP